MNGSRDDGTLARLFHDALDFHQAGRLADAETLYRQILLQRRRHFETMHMLGVCLHQRGEYEGAEKYLRAALKVRPDDAAAHLNYGNTMRELNRRHEALGSYRRAANLNPGLDMAHYNLGTMHEEAGDPAAALYHYERALALHSAGPAQVGRGNCLVALGRTEEAAAAYRAALVHDPDCVDACANMAALLLRQDRFEEALDLSERALALESGHGPANLICATAANKLGRPEVALRATERLPLDGGVADVDALRQRAQALTALGAPDGALDALNRAHALDSENWSLRFELAAVMARRPDLADAAMAHIEALLVQKPGDPRTRFNRGIALLTQGDIAGARLDLEAALADDPSIPAGKFNLAIIDLLEGRFSVGWQRHEGRWDDPLLRMNRRAFAQPVWLGEDGIAGKRLLVHAEQGLGDTLQFCRYLPSLVAMGASVAFEVPGPLHALLLRNLPAEIVIVPHGAPLPAFDRHCPMMSLPMAFGTTLQTIPRTTPYIHASPEHVDRWRHRVVRHEGAHSPVFRVGIAWSGNPAHANDRQRSIALHSLLPLMACATAKSNSGAVDFLALQNHMPERDRDALAATPQLKYFGVAIEDFEDAAALIALCDLVISVDTASAHLAGAMGKPVWLLLPHVPDWRWLMERSDSPWYPSASLYRQPAPGRWDAVLAQLQDRLARLLGDKSVGTWDPLQGCLEI